MTRIIIGEQNRGGEIQTEPKEPREVNGEKKGGNVKEGKREKKRENTRELL